MNKLKEEGAGLRRREFLLGMAASAVFLATGISFCDEKEEETVKEIKAELKDKTDAVISPSVDPAVLEMPVDESIKFPSFQKGEEYKFLKPSGLDVGEEEFMEMSKALARNISNGFSQYLISELAKNPSESNQIIQGFIGQTALMIETMDSRTKAEMDAFRKNWNSDPFVLVKHINEYINPAGLYLRFNVGLNGEFQINAFNIGDSYELLVSDDRGSEKVPVIELGSPLIVTGEYEADYGGIATCSPDFSHVLMYKDKIERSAKFAIERAIKDGLKVNDVDAFEYNFIQDVLNHEVIHSFLAKRFPQSATVVDKTRGYMLPLVFSLGGGRKLDLSGAYPPVMFQELAAVGAQIAGTKVQVPYANTLFLSGGAVEYSMVQSILPLANLAAAPDGIDLKEKISRELAVAGKIEHDDTKALVGDPSFTMDHAREAGLIMYRFGYSILEKANR